jgi:hypothetical protein
MLPFFETLLACIQSHFDLSSQEHLLQLFSAKIINEVAYDNIEVEKSAVPKQHCLKSVAQLRAALAPVKKAEDT